MDSKRIEHTPEEIYPMDEIWKEAAEEENKLALEYCRVNNRIFNAITSLKGSVFLRDLRDFIDYCQCDGAFEIVGKPTGKMQKESEFGKITRVWIDQRTFMEDNYYGWAYVKLKTNKWLKMHYSC